MTTHPFEDDTAEYAVLRNDRGQHSLWPGALAVPAGWQPVFGPALRERCLVYVEQNWTDLRPSASASAVAALPVTEA